MALTNARIDELPDGTPGPDDYFVFRDINTNVTRRVKASQILSNPVDTTQFQWVTGNAPGYQIGDAVLYNDRWYESLVDNNLDVVPGTDPLKWQLLTEPPSSIVPPASDIIEYSTLGSFPTTGQAGKLYIATDTNTTYRWNGSTYVSISSSGGNTPDASETVKGIAKIYNDLNNSNTDGAVTQSAIKSSFDNLFIQQSPSTGGATITINCAGRRQVLALLSTLSTGKIIALSNNTNTTVISILLNITGTITLTFPSTFRAEQSEVRWNNTTKALTLTGVTASPFELGAIWDGTFWRLKVTQDFYTS